MYSPIAFFCFNRPYHTMLSIQALSNNKEAKHTDLYAFIDGHKIISQIHLIDAVEKIILSYKDKFKSLNIVRSNVNLSSAVSQRRGISEVLNNHETVINVEDDVVVSPYFLSYMNKALNKYKNNPKVWHINGYSYPVNFETKFDCFFIRVMFCWGWGTWRDKWEKFNKDPLAQDPFYIESVFDEKLKKEFDLNIINGPWWHQVEENSRGKLKNTWDVFWYAYIFLNKGLCLTPKRSLSNNIGLDGSGIHCSQNNNNFYFSEISNSIEIRSFPENEFEDLKSLSKIKIYLENKGGRIIYFIKKLKNFLIKN